MNPKLERALDDIRTGSFVFVYDAEGREEETDFFIQASRVTPDAVRQMRRDGGGLIFLMVQDERELVRRLIERKTETDDDLVVRTQMAHEELGRVNEFDYLVINRDSHLDEAVDTIEAIIDAEHHRVSRTEAEE